MRMRDEMIEDRGTGEGERREEGRRKKGRGKEKDYTVTDSV